jgi:hypothetical protein
MFLGCFKRKGIDRSSHASCFWKLCSGKKFNLLYFIKCPGFPLRPSASSGIDVWNLINFVEFLHVEIFGYKFLSYKFFCVAIFGVVFFSINFTVITFSDLNFSVIQIFQKALACKVLFFYLQNFRLSNISKLGKKWL